MGNQKLGKELHKKKKTYMDIKLIAVLLLLLFRIPLARILGDEGNAYLAIAWEVYAFFSLFFVYGSSNVISRMVKNRVVKNQYRNCRRVLKVSIILGMIISIVEAVILYFTSDLLAQNIFYRKLAGISIRFFCFLLIVNAIIGILHGYFEGMGTAVPTKFSKLIEAIVTATGVFIFINFAGKYGEKVSRLLINQQFSPAISAAGVVVSYLCGSIFSLLFLCFVYWLYQSYFNGLLKKDETRVFESVSHILKEMCIGLLKVMVPAGVFVLYRIIDLILYSKTYLSGEETNGYAKILGSYYGKISVLISFTVVILLFLTNGNKLRMRKLFTKREYKSGKQYLYEELRMILICSGIIAVIFVVAGPQIMQMLFGAATQTEGRMARICGVTALFIVIGIYLYQILKYMKLNHFLFFLSVIALFIQTIACIFCMKNLAINTLSIMIAELVFWVIMVIGEAVLLMNNLSIDLRKKSIE